MNNLKISFDYNMNLKNKISLIYYSLFKKYMIEKLVIFKMYNEPKKIKFFTL